MKRIYFMFVFFGCFELAAAYELAPLYEFERLGTDVKKVAISPNGRYVLGMGTYTLTLWDTYNDTHSLRAISYPDNALVDVAFSESGAFYGYLVGGRTNEIVFVATESGEKIDPFDGFGCGRLGDADYNPDCGSWKLRDGSLPTTFIMSDSSNNPYGVGRIAVAFDDGNIQDWIRGGDVSVWQSDLVPGSLVYLNGETIVAGPDGWSRKEFGASEKEVFLNPGTTPAYTLTLRNVTPTNRFFYTMYRSQDGCSSYGLLELPPPRYLAALNLDASTRTWSDADPRSFPCDEFQAGIHPPLPKFVPLNTTQEILEIHDGDLVRVRSVRGEVVDDFQLTSDIAAAIRESGTVLEAKATAFAVSPKSVDGTRGLLAVARDSVISLYRLP